MKMENINMPVLIYGEKQNFDDLYNSISYSRVTPLNQSQSHNMLLFGENLSAMKYLIEEKHLSNQIDLIYIDPPYATNSNFTISESRTGTVSKEQNGKLAFSDKLQGEQFLEFMRDRLLLLHKLLSPAGSIYLHTDYKIGHYVKLIMDEVFGIENFRNDISRIKCNPKNFKRKAYGNIKDMILFYTKTDNYIWNDQLMPYSEADIIELFPNVNNDGRRYATIPLHAPGEVKSRDESVMFRGKLAPKGRHWRTSVDELEKLDKEGLIHWSSKGNPRKILYADEKQGKKIQDIWEYKDPQYAKYPTEKNSEMLNRIVNTSSNQHSIVLDCFCGSGTTLLSAHINNRQFIGIDNSEIAINTTLQKLSTADFQYYSVE